jgi:hypothetical protein
MWMPDVFNYEVDRREYAVTHKLALNRTVSGGRPAAPARTAGCPAAPATAWATPVMAPASIPAS